MRLPVLSFVFAALALPASAHAAEGDIIVVRAPGADAREIRSEAGVKLVRPLGIERTELVEPRDGDVAGALQDLRADADVRSAEADSVVHAAEAPNDTLFPMLWGLPNIFVADAWERSEGAGVTVGVVDTGVDADHEDLAGQLAGGYDFVGRDSVPQDGHGHGTHVTGTIVALGRNRRGVIGVASAAKVTPLRALGDDGSGFMSDIAAAFDFAGDQGLRIVNASLTGGESPALERAIAAHPDTLYVVAAGNEGRDVDVSPSYPCALPAPNLVCVAANDSRDAIASFSNFGATTVDLTAPGMGIRSTLPGGRYGSMNGTSMAAPHVAGVAALALAANPAATTAQLKWALLSSVDAAPSFAGKTTTGGRLNAAAAVAAITGPLPTPEPVAPPVETVQAPVQADPPVAEEPVVAEPVAPPAQPAPPVAEAPVSTPPAATPVAPRLLGVKVSGQVRVRFTLTAAATVRFTVADQRGRTVVTWSHAGRAGDNQVALTRRVRRLARGRYRLTVALSSGAPASAAIRLR